MTTGHLGGGRGGGAGKGGARGGEGRWEAACVHRSSDELGQLTLQMYSVISGLPLTVCEE